MRIFGVHIDTYTRGEVLKLLKKPQVIFTPNPEILLDARRDRFFKQSLGHGTLMLPDGHGLLLVTHLRRYSSRVVRFGLWPLFTLLFLFNKSRFKSVIPEIITGSSFMNDLVQWSAEHQKSVFFLGAGPGIAEKTAEVFKRKYPELKLAGCSHENPGIKAFDLVKASKAQVLFVAYGAPKQEEWIAEYAPQIPSLIHVMGVGGSFDFWSGHIKRAPRFIRDMGLEWLWRLLLQPKKRLRRIWNAAALFPFFSLYDA